MHFDRLEWTGIPDGGTAAAALHTGEMDWVEVPEMDLLPSLARVPKLIVETNRVSTAIGIARFNHLYSPFDNAAVWRALLGAIDQAEAMQAVAGVDPADWRTGIGLFGPGSPLANDEGIGVMTAPRDYDRVRRELAAAGWSRAVLQSSSSITHSARVPKVWPGCFRPNPGGCGGGGNREVGKTGGNAPAAPCWLVGRGVRVGRR